MPLSAFRYGLHSRGGHRCGEATGGEASGQGMVFFGILRTSMGFSMGFNDINGFSISFSVFFGRGEGAFFLCVSVVGCFF